MKVKYLKYIPLQKMVEAGMDEKEIILANVVIAFSKDDKKLRAGFDNIAEAVPSSNRTVRRTLESLQEKGFIYIASGYRQRNANTYYPTKKLKGLYGRSGHINKAKLATHTPKGYNSKEDYLKSLPHKDKDMAAFQLETGKTIPEVKEMLKKLRG